MLSRALTFKSHTKCNPSNGVKQQRRVLTKPIIQILPLQRYIFTRSNFRSGIEKSSKGGQKTVIRAPETEDQVRRAVVALCDNEIEKATKEVEETFSQSGFDKQNSEKYFASRKYDLTENKEGIVTMHRSTPSHDITVKFNRSFEEKDYFEDDFKLDSEEEDDDEDLEGGSKEQMGSVDNRQPLSIEVKFKKQGALSGTWSIEAFAGQDNRLYINAMKVTKDDNGPIYELDLDEVSSDLQDRIYDYFDVIGLDDDLAQYINYYILKADNSETTNFLKTLKTILEESK